MIVIYHCFGSAHSSVLAAAIHTRMLPDDRIPEKKEILNLPHYDKTPSRLIGTLFYFGTDEDNNRVYILGMGKAKDIILNAFNSMIKYEGLSEEEVIFIDTLQYVNYYVRIGGFLSRGLGIIYPGRFLTVYGLKKTYFDFVKAVRKVKEEIGIA